MTLTAAVLLLSGAACSSSPQQAAPSLAPTSSVAGGSSIPAAPATDVQPLPEEGSRNALLDGLAEAAEEPEEVVIDSVTDEGTDSATTVPPTPVDEATRSQLAAFGQAYLGYDHRQSPEARAEALEPLVAPDLLLDLATPLPAALLEELEAEERVVTPTLVTVEPVGGDGGDGRVFLLTYEVATATVDDGGEPLTAVQNVLLTVVTDAAGIVEDVR
ncbi:MAG: hypothetical protein AAF962_03955 [Actinomycetota bacterium]